MDAPVCGGCRWADGSPCLTLALCMVCACAGLGVTGVCHHSSDGSVTLQLPCCPSCQPALL
jgi:hypothetical protein